MLGLGSIGSRHARNLRDMGHEVIAYDPVIALTGELPHSREEAIGDTDAVVIASPTYQHWFDLDDVMRAGKHAFVEKPIGAQDKMRGGRCFEVAAEKSLTVFVGYQLRFHHCVTQAKKWIDHGLIGKPLWASFTCAQFNDKPAYLRDGVTFNWSHEIDLALHLLGQATVGCAAVRVTDGCDDISDIVLEHSSGTRSTIHLDYVTRPEERHFFLAGTDDTLHCDLVRRHIWPGTKPESKWQMGDSFDENYVDEMRAFIDRIEGKDVPGATGEDGLAALDICLQARRLAGLQ